MSKNSPKGFHLYGQSPHDSIFTNNRRALDSCRLSQYIALPFSGLNLINKSWQSKNDCEFRLDGTRWVIILDSVLEMFVRPSSRISYSFIGL